MKNHKILLDRFARIEEGYIDPPDVQNFLEVIKLEETLDGSPCPREGKIEIRVSNTIFYGTYEKVIVPITFYRDSCPKGLYEIISKFAEELEKYAEDESPVMEVTKKKKSFIRVAHRDNLVKLGYDVDGYKEDIMREHPDYLDDKYTFNFVKVESLFE